MIVAPLWDLSKLTDDELVLLERLAAKACGDEAVGDVVPQITAHDGGEDVA
jgi:hypothetical protein